LFFDFSWGFLSWGRVSKQLIQFLQKPGTIPEGAFEKGGLPWLTQGSTEVEIALSGVSAKIQPTGSFSPAEDALKRRVT
jgi:hypothetical protein